MNEGPLCLDCVEKPRFGRVIGTIPAGGRGGAAPRCPLTTPPPLPARADVGLGLGDGTSLVAGGFIDRAWYLASRSIRAAARLQRAGVAVRLASAVAHGVVLRRCGPVAW